MPSATRQRQAKPFVMPDQNPVVGIAFMLAAVTLLFPTMNTAVKYLTAEGYPYGQVVWARYVGHLVFMMIVFMPRQGLSLFRTARPGVQLMRSFLLFACTAMYFYALQYIDLTVAASISFTSPIIVTALSFAILGERVGIRRLAAVIVGFAGAMIIIRPGGEAFHWAMLLVVANTFSYAFYQLLTRKMAFNDNPETTNTLTAVVGALVSSFFLIDGVVLPDNFMDGAMFAGIGVLGGVGHYMVARSFQFAEASVVAPFSYGQLIGATILGFLVFGTLPDAWTGVGAVIVAGSGLYIAARERKKAVKAD